MDSATRGSWNEQIATHERPRAFDPWAFIQQAAELSRLSPNDPIPDEEKQVGCICNPFSAQEDAFMALFKETVRSNSGDLQEGRDYRIFEDPIGNVFAELYGTDRSLSAGMTGSHGDTVPNGGKYDGRIGIAIGLQTWHALANGVKRPKRTFRIAAFRGEESNQTGFACIGSFYATGLLTKERLKTILARPGLFLKDYFGPERWARVVEGLQRPTITPENTDWAFEAHIEQSHFIDMYKRDVGIVGRIGGAWRETAQRKIWSREIATTANSYRVCRITFTGVPAHTGAMPPNLERDGEMLHRVDALVASGYAAAEILRVYGHGAEFIRSEPLGEDTGFTLVPHGQVVELLLPTGERLAKLSVRLHGLQLFVKHRYGVEMAYTVEPYAGASAHVVQVESLRKLLLIPVEIANLATTTYQAEKTTAELGKTRVTITDFRFTLEKLVFKIDGREADVAAGAQLRKAVRERIRQLSAGSLVIAGVSESTSWPMDPALTDQLRTQAAMTTVWGRKLTWLEMDSHPGHDLKQIRAAGVTKTAMLFGRQAPNSFGISHSPAETFLQRDYFALARVAVPFMVNELSR